MAAFMHRSAPMDGTAPGRCRDCGKDAYIQLAHEGNMLCAHCYGKRLGMPATTVGRQGGEPMRLKPGRRASA
jgi:DNA-directed RNA polymerase subunit RPC12/RpoP